MTNYFVYTDQVSAQAAADDMSAKYVLTVQETDLQGNPATHQKITSKWDDARQRNDDKWIVQEWLEYEVPPEHEPLAIEPHDPEWFEQIVKTLSPVNNAVGVDASTNLVATFFSPIMFGTGSFHVYDSADQLVASLTIFGQVGQGGILSVEDRTLTVDLTDKFKAGTQYYVLTDADFILGFSGISDKTVWTWTVVMAAVRERGRKGRKK